MHRDILLSQQVLVWFGFLFKLGQLYSIIESQSIITPSAIIQKYFLEQLFTGFVSAEHLHSVLSLNRI